MRRPAIFLTALLLSSLLGLAGSGQPSNAASGTFSLDRLRLGGASGPENYIYEAGDAIFPDGGVDAGTYYKFVVKDAAGTVRNPSFPCTAAAAFATTDNRYTVQPTDPVSKGTSWKFTLNQYTSSACSGTPSKTLTKNFYVAKATIYADAGLTTQKSAFTTGQTAYITIAGVEPGLSNWNVTWLLPSGTVACANTGGTDRPESSGTGLLPKQAGLFLQFRPNTTATGSAWNREANYETRPCPKFGSANAGAWSLRLDLDATDFVVIPALTVDTSAPPSPSIDSAPADPSNSGAASFAFSDSEAGVSFLCQLDGSGFAACTSPKSYSGLVDGSHSFQLKARDAAGNESALVSRSWTLDTSAPLVSLTLPANGDTLSSSTPTFSGSAGLAAGDAATVSVRVYSGSTVAGSPLQTLSAPRQLDGSYLVGASSPLGNGTYTAQAQQSDAAGNLGRSLASTFTVAVAASPANISPPTISGTAQQGQTLSADPGSWSGTQPISYAYQWQRCAGYPGAVKADTPLAYWRLGEASGTTAADASGNGNIGSYLAGVQLGAGGALVGDADSGAAFDGVDDRVSAADTAALRLNGSFSIEFWAKLRAAANSFPGIIRKGDASSSGTGWFIYYNTTDLRPNFQRAGVATGRVSAAGALSTTAYKYYVLTYDAAGSTLRWYVNGALNSTYTGVTFPSTTDPSTLDLGRGNNYGNEYLDEVALYGSALGASRVSAHYAAASQACSDIAGATGQSYTAGSADVGSTLRVQVTASNTAGQATATSAPTGAVTTAPSNNSPPTISGTAQQGQTLSANLGSWSGTQPISYAYQWRRCDAGGGSCADIGGATGQSYLPVAADVGSTIRVQVTASNVAGSATATSAPTGIVMPAPPSNNSPPIISGTPQQGQTLTADPGSWSGTQPISYAYQWQRCSGYPGSVKADGPIGYWRLGETAGTTAADASGNGNAGSYRAGVQLGAGGALAGDADTGARFDGIDDRVAVADTPALRLNGSFSIEFWAKLRAAANSFPGILRKGDAGSGGTGWFIYYNTTDLRPNFQRAGVATGRVSAAGALSTTAYKYYVLTYDAAGSTLRWYVNGALDSTFTGVTFPTTTDLSTVDLGRGSDYGSEFLDDVALYGSALSATRITAHYSAATQSAAAGCADITGATAQTYTAGSADVGWSLRVQVTASNGAGSSRASSALTQTAVPPPTPTSNTSLPTIFGTAQARQTLSAAPGSWSGTQPIFYAYQWQRCDTSGALCADIGGATEQNYVLTSGDVGSTLRMRVTASNSANSSSAYSAQTAVVDDMNGDPILVGAGDIANTPSGASGGDEATAELLDGIVSANPRRVTVFTVGDNAYDSGAASEYASYYDPTWGRYKAITRPEPGNHDYVTPDASGYFGYFGAAAGDPMTGYYAYSLGAWRIYSLNNEIPDGVGSAEEQWLRSDLAAHSTTPCVLAYVHEPRFSSGPQGSHTEVQALWQALYDYGADVVVSGHDHNYQRFAPQNPFGSLDPVNGIREFVVGTGGGSHANFATAIANTEAYNFDTFGVLKLTLHATSYDFQFVPEAGKTFTDSGSANCH